MPLLGQLALWLALLLAVWGVVTGYTGARFDRLDLHESARRAGVAAAAAMGVAVLSLAVAAWRQTFHLAYIAAHADRTLATRDVWAVLLDGWAGQLLVAGWVLAAGLAALRHLVSSGDRRGWYASAAGSAALAITIVIVLFAGRPFAFLSYTPLDGQGLSQRLYDFDARLAMAVRCVAYPVTVVAAVSWIASRNNRFWASVAFVLLSADVGLSLWVAWRSGSDAWVSDALLRPALPIWIALTLALHVRRAPIGVAAHVMHAGVVLVLVGVVATRWGTSAELRLRPGESAPVARFSLTYLASSAYPVRNQVITQGLLDLRRDARPLGRLAAVRRQQFDVFGRERFAPALRAGSWHGLTAGVRVNWAADSLGEDAAEFSVAVVPLTSWLWLGWWLVLVGGIAAFWPGRERR